MQHHFFLPLGFYASNLKSHSFLIFTLRAFFFFHSHGAQASLGILRNGENTFFCFSFDSFNHRELTLSG